MMKLTEFFSHRRGVACAHFCIAIIFAAVLAEKYRDFGVTGIKLYSYAFFISVCTMILCWCISRIAGNLSPVSIDLNQIDVKCKRDGNKVLIESEHFVISFYEGFDNRIDDFRLFERVRNSLRLVSCYEGKSKTYCWLKTSNKDFKLNAELAKYIVQLLGNHAESEKAIRGFGFQYP